MISTRVKSALMEWILINQKNGEGTVLFEINNAACDTSISTGD